MVRYRSAGKTTSLAVDSGFAEVSAEVTVLTDRCVNAADVDVAATRAELGSPRSAASTPRRAPAEAADLEEARRLVDWAAARLQKPPGTPGRTEGRETPMDATADRIAYVADILLGAAYADGAKAGSGGCPSASSSASC